MQFDYRCEDARCDVAERAAALDGWLGDRLGQSWEPLRCRLLPPEGLSAEPRHLWRHFLCGFELARIESKDGAEAARESALAWANSPPDSVPIDAGGIRAARSHPALQRALDSSWRADIHGVSLVALPDSLLMEGAARRLAEALELLRQASPTGWGLVQSECAAVAIVTTDPPLADRGAVSLTVKRVPGAVIVSEVPLLLLAEGLVHEAAHLWLNGVERVRRFCADPDLRLSTPLRRDPRPVSGLLHQAWVLAHLGILHEELAASGHPSLAGDAARMNAYRAAHRRDLGMALDTLERTPGALTPLGRQFAESMRAVGIDRAEDR